MVVAGALLGVVMGALGIEDTPTLMAIVLPLQGVLVGAFVVARAMNTQRGARWTLALQRGRRQALLLLILPAGLVSDAFLQWGLEHLTRLNTGQLALMSEALDTQGWRQWSMLLGTVLVAPLYEELLFRGYVFRGFSRHSTLAAVGGSALLFAGFHGDPLHALGVLPLGLALSWIRWRTEALWPAILAHMLNNGIWAVVGLLGLEWSVGPMHGLAGLGACAAIVLVGEWSARRG